MTATATLTVDELADTAHFLPIRSFWHAHKLRKDLAHYQASTPDADEPLVRLRNAFRLNTLAVLAEYDACPWRKRRRITPERVDEVIRLRTEIESKERTP
jgi:hypothetical protein